MEMYATKLCVACLLLSLMTQSHKLLGRVIQQTDNEHLTAKTARDEAVEALIKLIQHIDNLSRQELENEHEPKLTIHFDEVGSSKSNDCLRSVVQQWVPPPIYDRRFHIKGAWTPAAARRQGQLFIQLEWAGAFASWTILLSGDGAKLFVKP
jgi:hypothetical protein